MSENPSSRVVDFAEYLRFEKEAAERHELIDSEIVAMAGATRRHNMLRGRLAVTNTEYQRWPQRDLKWQPARLWPGSRSHLAPRRRSSAIAQAARTLR